MRLFYQLEDRTNTVEQLRASLEQYPAEAEVIPVFHDGHIGLIITDEGEAVGTKILQELEDPSAAISR
jgi:hypothetical protein